MGTLVVYKEGVKTAEAELVTLEASEKGGALSYIGIADEHIPHFIITMILILAALIAARMLYVRHKRLQRQRRRAQRERNMRRREWDKERNPFDN